jgi:hypothetical protein
MTNNKREAPPPLPPESLLKYLGEDRGAKSKFASKLGISQQVLNNWLKRGVPRARLPEIAGAMGITTDDYIRKANGGTVDTREGPGDDFALLSELSILWGAIPPQSKRAILTIARDYRRLGDDYAGEVLRKGGSGSSLAPSSAVEAAYGRPGQLGRRKTDKGG